MLGLFGGSFNPIHLGHLALAEAVQNKLKLDEVVLIPCGIPVHKPSLFFSDNERLTLIDSAIKDKPYLSMDRREISSGNKNYTIDTLKHIKADNPNETLCFMMGMDSFADIKTWRDWQHLTDYAHLIVITRPHYSLEKAPLDAFTITTNTADLHKQSSGYVYLIEDVKLDISSSEIIKQLKQGKDITAFVGKTLSETIKDLLCQQ